MTTPGGTTPADGTTSRTAAGTGSPPAGDDATTALQRAAAEAGAARAGEDAEARRAESPREGHAGERPSADAPAARSIPDRPGPSPDAPAGAVPRAGAPRATSPVPGPGWASAASAPQEPPPTTVLPSGSTGPARPPRPQAAAGPRPAARPDARPASGGAARPAVGRTRRTRLALRRIDPWSVFVFSLLASVFLGVALVVAVGVLYAVLGAVGVTGSLNQLFAEVTGGSSDLLTAGRILGGAALLAAVNVVLLTLLATLGALLYNVCASFTGGIELTLGDRD